uniref:hypothetical protein n=1 Tax=Castellaniella defragrans TaxID=75697 RepID=UPI003341874B
MPHIPDDDAFQQFTIQCKKDLERIARATRKEHQFDDVVNEAWIMACDLHTSDGNPLVLSDADCQQLLLSHLYQHLVRYTDLKIRHAVRLDHAPKGGEHEGDAHPLAYLLTSDDGRDALRELVEQEADKERESSLIAHGSLAAAYVKLLRRFDNNMSAVADHLRISRSYAYRRCANARWRAIHMAHIPIPVGEKFIPGPWQSFRLRRPYVQLVLDFGDELLI